LQPFYTNCFGLEPGDREQVTYHPGTEDVYGPRSTVQELFDRLNEPKRLHWVEGGDHFFTDRLEEIQGAIRGWLGEVLDD
jgi:fermentation-respiration switch protein FrsA (DUF1100 family)